MPGDMEIKITSLLISTVCRVPAATIFLHSICMAGHECFTLCASCGRDHAWPGLFSHAYKPRPLFTSHTSRWRRVCEHPTGSEWLWTLPTSRTRCLSIKDYFRWDIMVEACTWSRLLRALECRLMTINPMKPVGSHQSWCVNMVCVHGHAGNYWD